MTENAADRHRKAQFDSIPFFPAASDSRIALFQVKIGFLTVDLENNLIGCGIHVSIKVARYRLILGPSRNPDINSKAGGAVGVHFYFNFPIPRVLSFLLDLDILSFEVHLDIAVHEKIDIKDIIPHRVHVAGNRGHEAGDVARAAGTGEPGTAFVLSERFQRVGIEEEIAAQGHTGDQSVIQDSFQDIDVLGVPFQKEHALVPQSVADRGACFRVCCGIRKIVVPSKSFSGARGSDASCQVELSEDDILPDTSDRLDIGRVIGERGHIRNSGIHVGRSHRMTDGLALFDDRFVILGVFAV